MLPVAVAVNDNWKCVPSIWMTEAAMPVLALTALNFAATVLRLSLVFSVTVAPWAKVSVPAVNFPAVAVAVTALGSLAAGQG